MSRDWLHISSAHRFRAVPRVAALDLPSNAMAGVSALFVSDVHYRYMRRYERKSEQLVAQISALHPDVIFWGGDLAEGSGHRGFFRLLARLRPPMGMYAVLGNNDAGAYLRGPGEYRAAAEAAGVRLLVNEAVRVPAPGGSLLILGLDDPKFGNPDLGILHEPAERNEYRVLLSHQPLALSGMPDDLANPPGLILCGHTHGGQINLGPLNVYRLGYERARGAKHFFVSGARRVGDATMIVSNGIGMSSIPWRVGAPPEMHLFRFHKV